MKTETFSGSVEAYQGKTLPRPIDFSGSVEVYENVAEAKSSEDWPGESETLKIVNRQRVTSAKASEYQKATSDLKKDYENSQDYKVAQLVKAAVGMGFSQAEAEALAASKAR